MSSEDAILQQLTRMTAALESMTSGVSSATDATRNFTEGMTEADKSHAEAKAIGDAANKRTEKATNEAIRSVASFSKALTSGAEGGFSKFSGGVESAAQSMATLVASHGKLGQVVANLTLASGKLLTLQMKQADDILAASDNIKKLGFAGDLSTQTFFDMAQNAKTSSAKLAEAMKRTQGGLITFGDDFGKGAQKFGEMIEVTDKQREAFQRLGVTGDELINGQADYLALQKASGQSMSGQLKDTKQLKQASLDYIENLVKLTKLTGQDIDQVKQAQLAVREAYEEKVLVRKENLEIAALRKQGLNDEADAIKNQQTRRQEFLDLAYLQNKEFGAMLAKIVRTEAFDSTTTGLNNVGIEAGKLATDLKNAKTAEEVKELFNRVAETISKGTDKNVQDLNASVQQSGEALGKKLGIFDFVFDKSIFEIGITADKLNAINKKIDAATGNPANPTKPSAGPILDNDPAEIARNYLTTILKNVTKTFQDFLYETNPLLKGLTLATGAASGLAIVAGGAAAVLTAKTGIKAAGSLMSSLGGVFGKGAPAAATAATAAAPAATAAKPGFLMSATDKIAAKAAAETAKTAASTATVAASEAALKTAGATASKSLMKAIPYVGSLLMAGAALGKIKSGDYIGAALEGTAALASLAPGPGTAIALALSGASSARDVYTALNPDLAKVPESVPEETPKSVAPPAASSVTTGGGAAMVGPNRGRRAPSAAPATPTGGGGGGGGSGGSGAAAPQQVQSPEETGRGAAAPAAAPEASMQRMNLSVPNAAGPAEPAAQGGSGRGGQGGASLKDMSAPAAAPAAVAKPTAAPASGGVQMGKEVRVGNEIRKGGSASWRTNNPGNISWSGLARQFGAIGTWKNPDGDEQQRTTGIAIMPSEEAGDKLKVAQWRRPLYNNLTIDAGVQQWAEAAKKQGYGSVYAKDMAKAAGATLDTVLGTLTDSQLTSMVRKQRAWEGWRPGTVVSAAKGGITDGPKSGYPATLHGNEIITPLSPNSILEQLGKTPATTEIAGSSSSSTTNTITEIYSMNTEIMELLAGKLDTMISKLSDSNDTQSKLLMYSRV